MGSRRCAGTCLDELARVRTRVFVVLFLASCSSDHRSLPDGSVAACDRVGQALTVGNVTARAFAPGIVHLRYGEATPPSWAVVAPVTEDPSARVGERTLCTDAMTVTITDGRVRTVLADGTVAIDDEEPFVAGTLVRRAQNDRVYGLGERTGGLDRRGRAWTFWNTDAYDPQHGGWAPGQDPLYQSIPLEVHLAQTAFGLFTDVTRRMVIELGGARDRTEASGVAGIDQYVIAGPRIADVVDRYTQLTGRPALPPRWALGFHQSRWGYANAGEIEAVAARFRELDIPADALWLDIQHMRGFRSFTFDPQAFPDPRGMIERLAARGFRVVAIEDPGIKIDPGWDVYDSGAPHFLRDGDGAIYAGTAWPGASAFPDFSAPGARAWWGGLVGRMLDLGIDGIWLDVNEPTTFPEGGEGNTVPDELVVDGDGVPTTMAALHNAYALFQARATFDAIASRGEQPFVLSRAGYAGIQRYAATWTGDTPSTWDGLQQTLPMLLGLGLSGMPFVGSDIGGYSGHASPELYARWLALGSISPFSRAHVTNGVPGQEPWQFGTEVTRAARTWLKERYRLLPYIYSLADEAARTGAPLLRPLVWEFQSDPEVATLADQAMLGPSLLVAPAVTQGATMRSVYLPAGRWYELASDAIVHGPTTIEVPLRVAALPIYVREGAIIPSTGDGNALVVDLYPGSTPTRFTLLHDDARTTIELDPVTDGTRVTITPARALELRVHRIDGQVAGVDADGTSAPYVHDANARTLSLATTASTVTLRYDGAFADLRPTVTVTFEVRVPAGTPANVPIYLASSATGWTHQPLTWVAPGVARGTLTATSGEWLDYKLTRGSWDTVEKLGDCAEAPNRTRIASATLVVDTVERWRDSGCN
jgi:alpha-glucosidase